MYIITLICLIENVIFLDPYSEKKLHIKISQSSFLKEILQKQFNPTSFLFFLQNNEKQVTISHKEFSSKIKI